MDFGICLFRAMYVSPNQYRSTLKVLYKPFATIEQSERYVVCVERPLMTEHYRMGFYRMLGCNINLGNLPMSWK